MVTFSDKDEIFDFPNRDDPDADVFAPTKYAPPTPRRNRNPDAPFGSAVPRRQAVDTRSALQYMQDEGMDTTPPQRGGKATVRRTLVKKKAPVRKTTVTKKAPVKKAVAKKAPAKTTTAKKTSGKTTTVKKASATKASTVKKASVKKAPVKKAPIKKTTVKKTTATKKAPVKKKTTAK